MRNQDFEKTMDAWADHETESAPDMQPTAKMHRMVRTRQKRTAVSLGFSRWTMAGAALASLLVFAFLVAVLLQPSILHDSRSGQQVAAVGLRQGFESETGIPPVETAVPPKKEEEQGRGKGPGKGPPSFGQLFFQIQRQNSQEVESVDLHASQHETIALTAADNYRLFLEPVADRNVYAFQLTPSNILVQLFPNEEYSPLRNPLRQEQTIHVPSEPNWFYLGGDKGQERLYIIASAQPLSELEDLVSQYNQGESEAIKQEHLSGLLQMLETTTENQTQETAGWRLVLDHQ